jgi:hypothetical protein
MEIFCNIPRVLDVNQVVLTQMPHRIDNVYNKLLEVVQNNKTPCASGRAYKVVTDEHDIWMHDPTVITIKNSLVQMFNITNVNDMRINYYDFTNPANGKKFHHDDAAKTPNILQNITVVASFFDNPTRSQSVVFKTNNGKYHDSINLYDNSVYTINRDVNVKFTHGVERNTDGCGGRISIVIWGWVENMNYTVSKISKTPLLDASALGIDTQMGMEGYIYNEFLANQDDKEMVQLLTSIPGNTTWTNS